MVKKHQKRKVVAKKSKKDFQTKKTIPKVKKSIKKESQKKSMQTRNRKVETKKKTTKKQVKKMQTKVTPKMSKKVEKKEVKKIAVKKMKVEKPKKEQVTGKPKKAKAEKKYIIYTANQSQTYQKAKKDLLSKSNKQLADILQANNQTKTGTKDNLIERIADGIALGQIPRCPHCFGGRLRFNKLNGEYSCPGYQDDDKFRFCNKKFQFNEITRSPWVEADS